MPCRSRAARYLRIEIVTAGTRTSGAWRRMAVTPSWAHQRTLFGEVANGRNIGGIWLLQRLRHDPDRRQDAVRHTLAPLRVASSCQASCRRESASTCLRRDSVLRPALLDDLEVLFEGRAIGGVDLVVLMREGTVDAVSLLRENIDPAPLIAAREPGVRAAPRSCDRASRCPRPRGSDCPQAARSRAARRESAWSASPRRGRGGPDCSKARSPRCGNGAR